MDTSEQGKFEVPEHVIHELGASAGDVSAASELIHDQDEPAAEQPGAELPEISANLRTWGELGTTRAIEKWGRYKDHFVIKPTNPPQSIDELKEQHPNFEADFLDLCLARRDLVKFGTTTEGMGDNDQNIGEDMRLALIPWGVFKEELARGNSLRNTVVELRSTQAQEGMPALDLDSLIMDNLENGNVRYFVGNNDQTIGVEQYVESRIAHEGNWGIMLMQTSEQNGIKRWKGESPTVTTLSEARNLNLGGVAVGQMGIFEILALTLQEELPNMERKIWLPANHFPDNDMPHPNNRWKSPPTRTRETMDTILARSNKKRIVRPAVSSVRI